MSWAETKYAINSTLGTDEFESLDKIFKGTWRLIESDNLYHTEPAEYSGSASAGYTITNSFESVTTGTCRFQIGATYPTDVTYRLNVLKNGVVCATREKVGTAKELQLIASVSMDAGDVFTFTITRVDTGGAISSLSTIDIYAHPIYAPALIKSL